MNKKLKSSIKKEERKKQNNDIEKENIKLYIINNIIKIYLDWLDYFQYLLNYLENLLGSEILEIKI